jgi:outer membrane cobalamin receptor
MKIKIWEKTKHYDVSFRRISIGILLICFCFNPLYAQHGRQSVIRGTIKNEKDEFLEYVTIYLKDTKLSTSSNEKGSFFLRVTPGNHVLCVQYMGYITYEKRINIKPQEVNEIHIQLEEQKNELNEVVVEAKSAVKRINETAFNVVAIDTRSLHHTTLGLTQALDRISGVKIKEIGGLGSNMQISLNGFSGRHVKVFMDGMPMEGFGSSFQINNIPLNLADRIEVYKGVVPVEFGADALGGAINIVTKQTRNTYVDMSYSYGSFNTHKSNLFVGHATKNGFTFQLNAYQNYSDNNYKVKTKLLDLTTNSYSNDEFWFERFHDNYHNEAVITKAGIINKAWADKLLFGVTLSQEKADIQNANLMKIVYGGKERRARSIIPSLNYQKKDLIIHDLNLSLNASYNNVRNNNADTLARQYNWKGEYRSKGSKGEGLYSLNEFDIKTTYLTTNLNYKWDERHYLALNNVYSNYARMATDAVANAENSTAATFMRRTNAKNVLGLSYKFEPDKRWTTSAFVKYYEVNVRGPIDVSNTTTAIYEERRKEYHTTGYGIAATYRPSDALQLKTSFEKAYRLPSESELFGDESLETGDASLKPENSRNVNFNISYSNVFDNSHSVYFDVGLIYRYTKD